MIGNKWLLTTETPGDGESLWIAIVEHDGVNTHVEYAETWLDNDGLLVHRFQGEKEGFGEKWPPQDVLVWQTCDMPEFMALCPFCSTPITTKTFESCCTSMIALRAEVRGEMTND